MITDSMTPTDKRAWAIGMAAYEPGDRPIDARLKAFYRGYRPGCQAYGAFIAGYSEALWVTSSSMTAALT